MRPLEKDIASVLEVCQPLLQLAAKQIEVAPLEQIGDFVEALADLVEEEDRLGWVVGDVGEAEGAHEAARLDVVEREVVDAGGHCGRRVPVVDDGGVGGEGELAGGLRGFGAGLQVGVEVDAHEMKGVFVLVEGGAAVCWYCEQWFWTCCGFMKLEKLV